MQQFYKFITWRFVSLNMFRATPRPSSGAYNCGSSVTRRGLAAYITSQTTPNNAATTTLEGKTRGC
jgi:hypothetical protein